MSKTEIKIPETIEVVGIGLSRVVFVDELILQSESKYDWGHIGPNCENLAKDILLKFLPEDLAEQLKISFCSAIVSQFPDSTFKAKIFLKRFIEMELGDVSYSKKVSAHHFMMIDYGGMWIPKSLDVVNMKFNTFEYPRGTWQHGWLSSLGLEEWRVFTEYVKEKSKRYSHLEKGNVTYIGISRDALGGYLFNNGIGSGAYKGDSLEEFENFIEWL